MFRLYKNSRIIPNLYKLIIKRYQSAENVALEPNLSIFSGHIKGDFINKLEFIRPEKDIPIPIYQILDSEGNLKDEDHKPDVSLIRDKS
jgi:hypothetical protein